MPTLHERLAELAEEAPATPTPAGIWDEGRRRGRARTLGTVAVLAAMLVVLAGLGGYAAHRSSSAGYADRPGTPGTPALPSRIYHPSPWLSGTGDTPPGQLSMLIPGKRGGWPHYHWGMVGVSATTGAYHYLEIPGCLDVNGLSPDGMHVSCSTGTDANGRETLSGLEIYDVVTGHLDRWAPPSGMVDPNRLTWSGNDAVAFAADGTSYYWRFGRAAPRVIPVHLPFKVGDNGIGLYRVRRSTFFYLDPAHPDQPTRILLRRPPRLTGPAAVSPSGRRIVVSHINQRLQRFTLLVGTVTRADRRVPLTTLTAPLKSPWIVGWSDDRHLLVENLVSNVSQWHADDPGARYDLDSIDVDTGRVVRVAHMSDQQTSYGAIFASSLLGSPTRDFPPPPHPLNQRLELGLVVGILLLGGVGFAVWRRRARA